MKNFIMILMMALIGTACSSLPKIPDPPKALVEYDPPKWVTLGGGAWSDSKGKAFYGVGSATGIRNYSFSLQNIEQQAEKNNLVSNQLMDKLMDQLVTRKLIWGVNS